MSKGAEKKKILRDKIRARDGDLCCWCKIPLMFEGSSTGRFFATIEHIKKREHGGNNHLSNVKLACRKCNNSRHSKDWNPKLSKKTKRARRMSELNVRLTFNLGQIL